MPSTVSPVDGARSHRRPGLRSTAYHLASTDMKQPREGSSEPTPHTSDVPPVSAAAFAPTGQGAEGHTEAHTSFGAESPIPGRETEYEALQAHGVEQIPVTPPWTDAERRNRRQSHLHNKPTAEVRQSHAGGSTGSSTAPLNQTPDGTDGVGNGSRWYEGHASSCRKVKLS